MAVPCLWLVEVICDLTCDWSVICELDCETVIGWSHLWAWPWLVEDIRELLPVIGWSHMWPCLWLVDVIGELACDWLKSYVTLRKKSQTVRFRPNRRADLNPRENTIGRKKLFKRKFFSFKHFQRKLRYLKAV